MDIVLVLMVLNLHFETINLEKIPINSKYINNIC